MKGKYKAARSNRKFHTTQPSPSLKRVHQTSVTTDHQRTPVAELVAIHPLIKFINTNKSDDTYLAYILMSLFQCVYQDPTWKDAFNKKYIEQENCLAAIKANPELAEECRKSVRSQTGDPSSVRTLLFDAFFC